MNEKVLQFKEKVEETMLGPLWARAKYSQKYPELLNDQKAIEIIKKREYDFSKIEQYLGEWRGLGLMVRARNFDFALRGYIEKNPYTTVVNLGAGLDTTFFRVDNSKLTWYDLDLPEAIDFRKKLITESERMKYISKSALDISWFDNIEFNNNKGAFFIAGGFVYYFKEPEISSVIIQMANRFPGAEMVFDTTSKLANLIINTKAKKAGEKVLRLHFGVGNPDKIFPYWSPNIELLDWYTIWSRTDINPKWHKKAIAAIKKSERVKVAKIVHLRFKF